MTQAEVVRIEKPAPPAIVAELTPLVEAAKAFVVVDVESNAEALERVKLLRAGEKRIQDYYEPARKSAEQTKKEILVLRDRPMGVFAEARTIYDRKADHYEQGERDKAAAEERRLQTEARKEEEQRQRREAIEADARGDVAEAEAILAETPEVPVVTVAPAIAKVEGVASRVIWSATIHDFNLLVRYVAAHPEWESLLEPEALDKSHPNLNRIAIAQRAAMRIPGVRAVPTRGRSTRS